MLKSGMNFRDRNDVMAYRKQGLTLPQMQALTKVPASIIQAHFDYEDEKELKNCAEEEPFEYDDE